jgi:hypothetical protein
MPSFVVFALVSNCIYEGEIAKNRTLGQTPSEPQRDEPCRRIQSVVFVPKLTQLVEA